MFAAIFMVEVPMDVSALVTEEWVARYNGPGNGTDWAQDIAVDSSGNVYLTGKSYGSGTSRDYTTIAYDTSGNELWVARYNGPTNGSDEARALVLDSSGNVYVTGKSTGDGTSLDYVTIKYDPSGNEQWVARYNGPANEVDGSRDIAVDSSGNIYVTGYSMDSSGFYDYATVKYDSNGTQIWVERYNGAANGHDVVWAIGVDSSGNVYVTGQEALGTGSGANDDYATVAYDSSGNELWVARYNGPGNGRDEAEFMALDSSGNIYVTGKSKGIGTNFDYATIKYDPQGNELWVARYNGPENEFDYAFAIATDSFGNVYVTGRENLDTNPNYATIAYDSSGNELWIARYDGPGNGDDMARDLAIDSFGNIYVTGDSVGSGTSADIATVAYDSNGNELWVMRYNGPGNGSDLGWAIATDLLGNVYVTGISYGNGTEHDYCTIKYSQAFPNQPPIAIAGLDQIVYEGDVVELNGTDSYDPDGTISTYEWDFESDGIYDYVETANSSPDGVFDGKTTQVYGDNGMYKVTLRITDDDGLNHTNTCNITVNNVAPIIDALPEVTINEFETVTLSGHATDPGSDDLTFTWSWEYAPWGDKTTIYFNDGIGPDPYPSPLVNPRNITEDATCQFGDDGIFTVTLTVTDDDGGLTTVMTNLTVNNVAPTVSALPAVTINEFESVTFTGHATDPGSDDLTFTWRWEYAPWGDKTTIYYNDGSDPDPYPSPAVNPRNITEDATCQYGDDSKFKVTLTVTDDDGGSTTVMTNVSVNNVNPTVTIESVTMDIEVGLRVAGRKYNNVSMTLFENGNPIGNVSIERMPGSPNEQMAWIPATLDLTRTYNATVIYTPEDPPNIGGNPVWIYIKFEDGSIEKIHHTFNVQQSKKRDSEHWNHVEPWEVDINAHLIGHSFEITSHITDPGSDDETLTFIYGSQVKTFTYLNNPPNQDPYPSPEVKPMDITETTTLVYEGPGSVTLIVKDDDNIRLGVGQGSDSITLA